MAESIGPSPEISSSTETTPQKPKLNIGNVVRSAFVTVGERAIAQVDLGETPEPVTFSEIINEVMSGKNVMARYKPAMDICKLVLEANPTLFPNRQPDESTILSLFSQPRERSLLQAFAKMQIDNKSDNEVRNSSELRSLTALLDVTNGLARTNLHRTTPEEWGYSRRLDSSARVKNSDFVTVKNETTTRLYEEKGTAPDEIVHYQGRKVIRRDSTIEGGVYVVSDGIGNGLYEATVVDSTADKKLENAYIALLRRLDTILTNTSDGKVREQNILGTIYQLALEAIPYDMEKSEKAESLFPPGTKISLGSFFGGGVCRHQALLIGWLAEKLIADKVLMGKISLERNQLANGGHSWARFTSSDGSVTILDAAQNYVGAIVPADDNQRIWNYARPGETPPPIHVEQSKPLMRVRELLRKQRQALQG